jgi:hypothetical protein
LVFQIGHQVRDRIFQVREVGGIRLYSQLSEVSLFRCYAIDELMGYRQSAFACKTKSEVIVADHGSPVVAQIAFIVDVVYALALRCL